MSDRIVDLGGGSSRFHTSVASLNDIIARENVEYLMSLDGIEGIAGMVFSDTTTGLSADEAADGYSARIAAYVVVCSRLIENRVPFFLIGASSTGFFHLGYRKVYYRNLVDFVSKTIFFKTHFAFSALKAVN